MKRQQSKRRRAQRAARKGLSVAERQLALVAARPVNLPATADLADKDLPRGLWREKPC